LQLEKNEFYFCEPIRATYELRNEGDMTILIPREIIEYPKGNPDFWIIHRGTGKRVYTLERFYPDITRDRVDLFDRCVSLQPGKRFTRVVDLAYRYYPDNFLYGGIRLDQGGEYEVSLLCENTSYKAQGSTSTVFMGAVRSNPVRFRLRGPDARERKKLREDLKSRDPIVWRRALDGLSIANDPEALPFAYSLIESADTNKQLRGFAALARFSKNPQVLERLHSVAATHPSDWTRMCAVDALGQIRNLSSVPVLGSLCGNSSYPKASLAAARVLLMDYEAADRLRRIESVMESSLTSEARTLWRAKIREIRRRSGGQE
jgi:hypothetical protein